MCTGVDIRVHAQGNTGELAQRLRPRFEHAQFGNGFHIELQDPAPQSEINLLLGLADSREYDLLRIHSDGKRTQQLTS